MPSYRHHEMGDLIVQLSVKFPDVLDPELLAPLETILPARPPLPDYGKEVHLDNAVEMGDADEKRAGTGRGEDAMDEDDEQSGGPQVSFGFHFGFPFFSS